LADVRPESLARSFAVNAVGPLLVARHFESLLAHEDRAVFASLSARVGSIEDNRLGGWYAYRASKAAQNMYTRTLAIEWARSRRNVVCVALHPGTTDTDLSRPFQGNVPEGKLFGVERTVSQLLEVIDRLQPADTGQFLAWDGERIPW
jgi:NAD(P)-dependent dehydrogenase (short-subunit alcohol dehydrogenase family)